MLLKKLMELLKICQEYDDSKPDEDEVILYVGTLSKAVDLRINAVTRGEDGTTRIHARESPLYDVHASDRDREMITWILENRYQQPKFELHLDLTDDQKTREK